jgi:hypothetical protein
MRFAASSATRRRASSRSRGAQKNGYLQNRVGID